MFKFHELVNKEPVVRVPTGGKRYFSTTKRPAQILKPTQPAIQRIPETVKPGGKAAEAWT